MQEVYDGHEKSLEKRYRTMEEFGVEFGNSLPHSAFEATVIDTDSNTPWGNAVFSRFPILGLKTTFFDLPFGEYSFTLDPDPRLAAEGVLLSQISIDSKTVTVGSWHGVWNNHGRDTEERFIMVDEIIESLKNKKTIILAGDTNMNPDTKATKKLQEELSLTSVFGATLKSTFNMRHKTDPGYAKAAVDMVFVSNDIKVVSAKMPKVDVSDHMPLVVEIEI